jgi:transcriptional regulator with XRE-family HTH domain
LEIPELPTWADLRRELEQQVEARVSAGESWNRIAAEVGMSRPGLQNLIAGETEEPRKSTQLKIYRWLHPEDSTAGSYQQDYQLTGLPGSPEQELLEFFLEHHPEMAIFMSTTTEGLSPEDRRKVAVAIFNGFKKLAIQAGEKLPDWFFDLERRFVAE